MITIQEVKDLLDKSENPLIFFDDDPDGLCSYMLMMKYLKRGNGIIVKNSPTLDVGYITIVRQYAPDLVVVLDKPKMSQDFIDKVNCPLLWIDHHPLNDVKGVKYFNPKFLDEKDNRPTTYWCWKIVDGEKWIALLGIISDWSLESFKELSKDYKELFEGVEIKNPDDAMFDTEFGKLIRIVSFGLKGTVKESYNFVQIMMKIEGPREILQQNTENGKKVYERFDKRWKRYELLYDKAIQMKDDEKIVFTYVDDKYSFTSDLANDLLHRTKAKFIFVGREDKGEIKASARNREKGVNMHKAVQKALDGLNGYGGGHDHAIGCCVKMSDFPEFIERFKKLV